MKCFGVCRGIEKKSKSPAFAGLRIGDTVKFSVPVKEVGKAGNRSKAAYITCLNERTEKESNLSFNQLGSILKGFYFEEL